ncbi:MAG: tetratricopeptide repeat protein [Bacteroidales bacterium]
MTSRLLRRSTGIILLLLGMVFIAEAQDRNAVIQAYNEGAKAIQTDAPAAIKAFENTIALADKVGESAADLKQKAQAVLPGLYQKVAAAAINEKKTTPEVLSAARAAMKVSEKFGTQAQKDNALKIMAQAYGVAGSAYFSKNDYANAIAAFDSVLAINPASVGTIYNKALVYMKQNDAKSFGQTIDTYISKVKEANDEAKVKQASTLALGYFRGEGSKANQAEKLDDAIANLDKAASYGEDKDLYYYYADVYNKKKTLTRVLKMPTRDWLLRQVHLRQKPSFTSR